MVAVEWELLDESPMRRIRFLRENNVRLRYLSIDECGILDLKFADLDFVSGVLIVRDSKNGDSRHIPMDSTMKALLKRTQPVADCDYVFPNAAGKRWNYSQRVFKNVRKRAGLADLNGGDLYALRGILGHKSVAMTQRYARLSPAYQRAMVDRMEAIWAKPDPVSIKPPVKRPAKSVRRSATTPFGSSRGPNNPAKTRIPRH